MLDHADVQLAAYWDAESTAEYERYLDWLADQWELMEHGRREAEGKEVKF